MRKKRVCTSFRPIGDEWVGGSDVHVHVKIWLVSSDAGPDQAAAQKMIMYETRQVLDIWIFAQFCLLHQVALMVKRQLALLDPYWSMLAKLVNLWRCVFVTRASSRRQPCVQ